MTLFHTEWCPECRIVRDKLEDLGIQYQDVVVPDFRPLRKQVHEVSGQYYVPVLVDGDSVLSETHDILAYLDAYPERKTTEGPQEAEGSESNHDQSILEAIDDPNA